MYNSEHVLMTKIAILYYEDGYTQEEIGQMLNMSRLQVHRRLKAAVDSHIVEIRVESEYRNPALLETALKDIFNLKHVVVVRSSTDFDTNVKNLAQGGAELLLKVAQPGDHLAASWGNTVSKIPPFLEGNELDITVGNIVGGLSVFGDKGAQEVAMRIALALKATPRLLNLPYKLETRQMRDLILQDESVKKDLKTLKSCDLAVVGIGYIGQNPDGGVISQYKESMQVEIKKLIKEKNAAGEIFSRYFDSAGEPIHISALEDTVIGLSLEDLRHIPLTIGVAGGIEKTRAIVGALRGRFINCLVTDEITAQAVIDAEKNAAGETEKTG